MMGLQKSTVLITAMLLAGSMAFGQMADLVVMTINGKPVSRSEFEYAYRKNRHNPHFPQKSVEAFADLFVDYKLKVEAALDAGLDTALLSQSAATENVAPMVAKVDVETEARRLYEQERAHMQANGGVYQVAQIYLHLGQRDSKAVEQRLRQRIDSIAEALRQGADFATLARRCSDMKGGEPVWMQKGELLPEVEQELLRLKVGEMSRPFLSPAGFHILMLKAHRDALPYDSLRGALRSSVTQRAYRRPAGSVHITPVPLPPVVNVTDACLAQEMRNGLLLCEISNRMVWAPAAGDEAGLQNYFNRHKKNYQWEQTRYRGIAYRVKTKSDLKAVRKRLAGIGYEDWIEVLHRSFADRIRVEQALFTPGRNAIVDKMVFKQAAAVPMVEGYDYVGVYGKKLKKPKTVDDVRGAVTADYQEFKERQWVESLRKRYTVVVNRDVLATVNQHE